MTVLRVNIITSAGAFATYNHQCQLAGHSQILGNAASGRQDLPSFEIDCVELAMVDALKEEVSGHQYGVYGIVLTSSEHT